MCLAKAYFGKSTGKPVLQDIAHMQLHDGWVELETLLGEHKIVPGRVAEIDFASSKILLDKSAKVDKF
jgi:predicted RNA-binding protein